MISRTKHFQQWKVGTAISVIRTNRVASIVGPLLRVLAGRGSFNAFLIILQNVDPTISAGIR
jgi:hypothetical protein